MWRAMRRRCAAGRNPSIFDYPRFGETEPSDFLEKRHSLKIKKAVRQGLPTRAMTRRGLFDALRHHQNFRAFPIMSTAPRGAR